MVVCSLVKARRRGIVDESLGVFVDVKTGDRLPLSDAVDAGLVTANYSDENGQHQDLTTGTETKTYAVNSVVDQVGAQWHCQKCDMPRSFPFPFLPPPFFLPSLPLLLFSLFCLPLLLEVGPLNFS